MSFAAARGSYNSGLRKSPTAGITAGLAPSSSDADATAARFQNAIKLAPSLPDLSRAQTLRLYGLFKAATDGECPAGAPPDEPRARAKWEAWASLRGIPRHTARDEYSSLVETLATHRLAGESGLDAYPSPHADPLTRKVPGRAARKTEGTPLLITEASASAAKSAEDHSSCTPQCKCTIM